MLKKIAFILISLILSGCAVNNEIPLYQDEYLEVSSNEKTYSVSELEIEKSENLLLEKLKEAGIKKLLLTDFKMGDLLSVGTSLKANGYELFIKDKNNEIKKVQML